MYTKYIKQPLSSVLVVQKVISLHYFEFTRDFSYDGEKHPFWELVFIDKGELEVIADDKVALLKKDELIFHKPDEFHSIICNGKIAPNVIILSFDSNSKAMNYFRNKIMHVTPEQKQMLANIVKEGMAAFQGPFDIPFRPKMYKNKKAPFGAEQRLKNLLELLLIDMVRHGKSANQPKRNIGVSKNSISFHAVDQAIRYMEQNLESDITVDDLCKTLNLSKSTFKHIFKEVTGRPPIRYLIDLRITRAKQLIREENLNMTQIAASLGFHSVHYFSRYFKKATGLSPTQYANTVKSNLENLP